MTISGPLENGLPFMSKRISVVRIEELPICSPSLEDSDQFTHGCVEIVGKIDQMFVGDSTMVTEALSLKRPHSRSGHCNNRSASPAQRRRSSSLGHVGKVEVELPGRHSSSLETQSTILHKVRSVGSTASLSREGEQTRQGAGHRFVHRSRTMPLNRGPGSASLLGPLPIPGWHAPAGVLAPPTPPEDEAEFKWDTPQVQQADHGIRTVASVDSTQPQQRAHTSSHSSTSSRPSEIQLPELTNIASEDSNRPNWLGRACQHLVTGLDDTYKSQQVNMVVQALPSKKSTETRPVHEKVLEDVQTRFTSPPYITITHAYYEAISMDEVPASPPATPNANYSANSDSYFQDQTIFTHAAAVPAYHFKTTTASAIGARPTNIIAAPGSVQVSILERYIPPTTGKEVDDFFSFSRRSYLADRLLELSPNNGSLLLIYPTKKGGQTFVHEYIGPIIEPFLRQFILLNNLYADLAAELGQLAAVPKLKTLEEMKASLIDLCSHLTPMATSRGSPSTYEIVHAETASTVLDDTLWRDWFIEQETPRLRQNLIDYHKSGGRMPARSGRIEITPGMLAREVVDGVRQSRQVAGNVGMEVGVFVIRRKLVV